MSTIENKSELDRLRMVVDVHGANPARWPKDEAARLLVLADGTPTGKLLLNEAAALDRVLARAPAGAPARLPDLLDRIVAQAASATGHAFSAEIVPLPVRAHTGAAARAGVRPRYLWPVFGALAASLLIGFYVGASDLATPALQQVAGMAQDEPDATTANPGQAAAADEGQEGELL